MHRGLSIKVDLGAASHNLKILKKNAGGGKVIAVVKADAYGHGALAMSAHLLEAGAEQLAVAFVSEAMELRRAGIAAPIIVLFDTTDIPALFKHSLTPVVHDIKTAIKLDKAAQRRRTTLDVHMKVDTGMGRMGFDCEDVSGMTQVLDLNNLRVVGLMSHFADADLQDKRFSLKQIDRFNAVRHELSEMGLDPLSHMSNSAATLSMHEATFDAVRPGIALYGVSPFTKGSNDGLKPVMSASAPIIALRKIRKGCTISYGRTFKAKRDMLAAVLACGYADGYSRTLSGKANVIIKGKRAPIVGRVCMDLTVADVTDIKGVSESDSAVLLGSDGKETVGAWELAQQAGTIPYEILTSLGRCAKRGSA